MGRRKHAGLGEEEAALNEEQQKAMDKIKDLGKQIQKIHDERKRTSPMGRFNNPGGNLNTSTTMSKKSTRGGFKKNRFYHPNLDYVFAEVSNSPYLTPPNLSYSKETLHTSSKLRKLKVANQGKPLRDIQDTPCDVEKAEESFVKKVIEYKPLFDMNKDHSTNNVIGVHDPPRPAFIVYPNKYKPLAGHTGKVSHIQPYLLFDPTIKYEVPPKSNGILTMADYRRYLKQLNGKNETPKQVVTVMKQISSRSVSMYKSQDDGGSSACGASIGLPSFNQEEDFESTPSPHGVGVGGFNSSRSRPSSRPSSARLKPLHEPQSQTSPNSRPSTSPALPLSRSNSQSSSTLQRQGSGTFQAHTARAGPEMYLSQIAVQKSYKQFIKSFSRDGIDGEEDVGSRLISRDNSFKSNLSRDNSFCSHSICENTEEKDKDNDEEDREEPTEIKQKQKQKKKPRSKRTSVSSFEDTHTQSKKIENPFSALSDYHDMEDKLSDTAADKESKPLASNSNSNSKDQPDEMSAFDDDHARDRYESKAEGKSDGEEKEEKKVNNSSSSKLVEETDNGNGNNAISFFNNGLQVVTTSDSKVEDDEDADLSIYQDDDDFESCTSQKIADNDEQHQQQQERDGVGGGGGGLLSPLSLDHVDGDQFANLDHDNENDHDQHYTDDLEDDQDTHTLEAREEEQERQEVGENRMGLELNDGDDDDLSMPLGLDTKSMILSKEGGQEMISSSVVDSSSGGGGEEEKGEEKEKDLLTSEYPDEYFEEEEDVQANEDADTTLPQEHKQHEQHEEQDDAYGEDDFEPLSPVKQSQPPATSTSASSVSEPVAMVLATGNNSGVYDLSDDD